MEMLEVMPGQNNLGHQCSREQGGVLVADMIKLSSGLLQFTEETRSEDASFSLLRSLCHPLQQETSTSQDQRPALPFLCNAQESGMSNAMSLSWISSPLAVSLTAFSGLL